MKSKIFIMEVLHKKSWGFTLIELIIVIVIISIITIVAMPQVTNTIQSKRLYDAVEKLNDDLNYCRDYAIAQHTNTWISFTPNQERYRLFYGDDWGSRTALIDPARSSASWFYVNTMFIGVEIKSTSFSSNRLSFNWWGTPSEGGTVVLTNDTIDRTLTVNPETGYVQR